MRAVSPRPSLRTCVGCRQRELRARLVRLTRTSAGRIQPDPAALGPGRGAWVHPRPGCVARAARKNTLSHALRGAVTVEAQGLWRLIRTAVDDEAVRVASRWERSRPETGPLKRRLEALRVTAAELATGSGA